MTRQEIIEDLMECLGAIGPDNHFSLQPQTLRRGIHLASQAGALPALTLFNQRVATLEQTGTNVERTLTFHLWGATQAPHDDYSDLDALAAACVNALNNPAFNPHWDRTSVRSLEIYEGGASDPLGLFDLVFDLTYESPLGTL
jgi:hypothetical protein